MQKRASWAAAVYPVVASMLFGTQVTIMLAVPALQAQAVSLLTGAVALGAAAPIAWMLAPHERAPQRRVVRVTDDSRARQ